ncbi:MULTISPECIES: hypothetical protein [unclassified Actinotignum]|uniref:hypothetical protein n=1 Tax=unclassified Actinotignum TaxID=2632702 RepID=UPI002A83C387|nr:hypothetical protein [Actinotignum sp. SLA_B059]MDY5127457.1 hypothetical protein [Actinotignum sp. SLA_B059]
MERQLAVIPADAGRPPRPEGEEGAITTAVNESLKELEEAGLINGKYRAIAATLRQTAAAVDIGLSYGGKVSVATATLTKNLFDTLEKLPDLQVDTGNVFDTLTEVMREMTTEALAS